MVAAYYLHGTGRCAKCIKFEEYSDEVIRTDFAEALKKGTLEWHILNTDKAEHEHFVEDFQMVTKGVVVAEVVDGKVKRYKNLDKIWSLVKDKDEFQDYIRSEVEAYIKGGKGKGE